MLRRVTGTVCNSYPLASVDRRAVHKLTRRWACLDDIMEELLDQEGVEVDPVDRMEGDTPLHSAVRYVNKQDKADWKGAQPIVEILIEAGSDPK